MQTIPTRDFDLLPDLCDHFPNDVNVFETQFNSYGQHQVFCGQAVTVKCFEDNSVVKKLVGTPGQGKVIVVDGGASMRRALIGDMLAEEAIANGWAGVVINGCLRDAATINQMAIGVKALGTIPIKTDKRGLGDQDIDIRFAGVTVKPGDWVYADLNGVLISAKKLELLES
ncbi:putative 4-hydroxy-4-methyl-2-oxoglutarate aldolase [Thalassotalea euphylliae]|uniref:4-hydroxy-4-methyl-2-oxoglutarate aldolase n=1 Tax=Thalassotalea euphylliae TaxID=1655234 RepID=A0A3E0U6F7_9GAMM|nr:putative 4-hydroxy-4-methyl-2-oxoglutarate aldolase [Thalassotalea euphylliae]REL31725.1 putative 4-hydroxy-4-methyl-2-oxoglutarate aldolase [Thalassotalea euphylliae]